MNASVQTYTGSCHCRRVTFEVRAKLDHVVDCNCSICHRVGALWHGAKDSDLRILTGESDLALYQFNKKIAKHYFCTSCGVHPFTRPRLDPTSWAFNVRCIDGVELSSLAVRPFDGSDWETAAKAFYASLKKTPV